jgi:hypothetical protein
LGVSKGFIVLEICNESAGYRANSFLLPLQFVAVRQGNVLFKENGKEENALQLSIPHTQFI